MPISKTFVVLETGTETTQDPIAEWIDSVVGSHESPASDWVFVVSVPGEEGSVEVTGTLLTEVTP